MEVVMDNTDTEERDCSMNTDNEEQEEGEKDKIQDVCLDNVKIVRVDDNNVKKDFNKEETEFGSCCDSSHDEGNSILHNIR